MTPHLIKHALGVEVAMRYYARHYGEDENLWGIAGLLHDLDYDKHPSLEEHPFVGIEILRAEGYPEEILQAVLAHADHTGVPRRSLLDRALYAVDELVGFVVAVALVRPSKSVMDLPVKSVTKKFKDKAFFRAIDRDHLRRGSRRARRADARPRGQHHRGATWLGCGAGAGLSSLGRAARIAIPELAANGNELTNRRTISTSESLKLYSN